MSSVVVDVADVFADLYDRLDAESPVTTELEAWPGEPVFEDARRSVGAGIADDATVDRAALDAAVAGGPVAVFGALSAVDARLRAAHDQTPGRDPVTVALQQRRWRSGAYLSSPERGAVLAKRVEQREPQVGSETLRDALGTLRVAPELWRNVEFVVLREPDLDHRHAPGDGFVVHAVPMGVHPDDLQMTSTRTARGRLVYVAEPGPAIAGRVPAATSALRGADLGMAPEATLSPVGLSAWQAAAVDGAATWVLAGTGPVADPGHRGASANLGTGSTETGEPLAPNRAVLLHGPSGEVLAVQDKRSGFTITRDYLDGYGLRGAVRESHDEGMEPGSRLTMVESRAGRFAMYVCEDLGRTIDLGGDLVQLGVTHLLVPILATPMLDYRWQHLAGGGIAQRAGTTVMVANSLTLGRFDPDDADRGADTLMVLQVARDDYSAKMDPVRNLDAVGVSAEQDAVTARVATVLSR